MLLEHLSGEDINIGAVHVYGQPVDVDTCHLRKIIRNCDFAVVALEQAYRCSHLGRYQNNILPAEEVLVLIDVPIGRHKTGAAGIINRHIFGHLKIRDDIHTVLRKDKCGSNMLPVIAIDGDVDIRCGLALIIGLSLHRDPITMGGEDEVTKVVELLNVVIVADQTTLQHLDVITDPGDLLKATAGHAEDHSQGKDQHSKFLFHIKQLL